MKSRKPANQNLGLFSSFEDTLNQKHPLFQLSNKINWQLFEESFSSLYSKNIGRPAKPIRLMCGLLMLKHIRNISDESVVEQWSENSYYQYFCGESMFVPAYPCDASDMIYFRKRIGESGVELILQESIRVNNDNGDSDSPTLFIDSTVQQKNITYPTDAKLHRKIIAKCLKIVQDESLPIRQTYTQTIKKLGLAQRFRSHPLNRAKARSADRKVRTIAGRLVRELGRNLPEESVHHKTLSIFIKILSQKRGDKQKIYSIHEPDVQCISKGKEHKKYEFGNKVSIIWNIKGVIVGAMSFRNEYDGHTLPEAVKQAIRLTGVEPQVVAGDRGYRGISKIGESKVLIPKKSSSKQSRYQSSKLKKLFSKRAGIEPIIGHLKSDHRLGRNFYKGLVGDSINIMLAAAAFNFKRAMRALLLWIIRTRKSTSTTKIVMCFD